MSDPARELVRDSMDPAQREQFVGVALRLLSAAVPTDTDLPAYWPQVDPLIDHVLSVVDAVEALNESALPAEIAAASITLLERIGGYFESRGRFAAAQEVLERALVICQSTSAVEPWLEGDVRRTLGTTLQALGRHPTALVVLRAAHTLHQRAGAAIKVAGDLIDLAAVLEELGRHQPALQHVAQALELLPHDEFSERARARRVRAWVFHETDRQQEARAELEAALEELQPTADDRQHLERIMVRAALGVVLGRLGERAAGIEALEESRAQSEAIFGLDHPEVGILLSNVAPLHATDQPALAREYLERSLEIAERRLPDDHPAHFIRRSKLAELLERDGDLGAALQQRQHAIGLAERDDGGGPRLATALEQLGWLQRRLGRNRESEATWARAVYVAETIESYGPERLDDLRRGLAASRVALGDHAGALSCYVSILRHDATTEASQTQSASDRIMTSRILHAAASQVTRACQAVGHPDTAELVGRMVSDAIRTILSDAVRQDDPEVVLLAANAAAQVGAWKEARRGLETLAQVARHEPGRGAQLADTWGELAAQHLSEGNKAEALRTAELALGHAPDDPDLMLMAAKVDDAAERPTEALELAARAAQVCRRGGSAKLSAALQLLGGLQERAGQVEDALNTRRERLNTVRRASPRSGAELASALEDLAWMLRNGPDAKDAIALAEEAVAVARTVPNRRLLAATLLRLGRLLEEQENFSGAQTAYEERLAVIDGLPRRDHQSEGVTLHDLGDVRMALGQPGDAVALYERALGHKQRAGRSRDVASTQWALARAYRACGDLDLAQSMLTDRADTLRSLSARDLAAEIDTRFELADLLEEQGRLTDAATALNEAEQLAAELGDSDRRTGAALGATALGLRNGDENARRRAREVVTTLERVPNADPRGLALACLMSIGGGSTERERNFSQLLRAFQEFERVGDPDPVDAATIGALLAEAAWSTGELEVAHAVTLAVRPTIEQALAGSHGSGLDLSAYTVANAYLAAGLLGDAHDALERLRDPDENSAVAWLRLGRALISRTAYVDAASAFERAVAEARQPGSEKRRLEAVALDDLADCRRATGDVSSAIDLYRRAAELTRGQDKRSAASVLVRLARSLSASGRQDEALAALDERRQLLSELPTPDRSGERLTDLSIANVLRLQGKLEPAAEAYRTVLDNAPANETDVRFLAGAVFGLGSVEHQLGAPGLTDRAKAAVELTAQSVALVEHHSPKDLTSIRIDGPRPRRRDLADAQANAQRLAARTVSGLIQIGRTAFRVPLPAGDQRFPAEAVERELSKNGLLRRRESSARLTARGRALAEAVLTGSAENEAPTPPEVIALLAQLSLPRPLGAKADIWRTLLDESDLSLPATAARILLDRWASPDHADASARADLLTGLDEAVRSTADPETAALMARLALDYEDLDRARTALSCADPDRDPSSRSLLTADVGVTWHSLALASECRRDVPGARAAYQRAAGLLSRHDPELGVVVMRQEADMLRAIGASEAAEEVDRATPFVPRPITPRLWTAETCLRSARLQAHAGRSVHARVEAWRAASLIRFVPPAGIEVEADRPALRGRQRTALTPTASALLELLRQDRHDSLRRGLSPGLTISRENASLIRAAIELRDHGQVETHFPFGWLRLADGAT